jgi:DNA invertase Pin-like site-specific DNA recombinase
MAVRRKGRGAAYLRRSGDKQETSLEKQLTWALGAAKQQGVPFDATLGDLQYMQAGRLHKYKDIYLDDALSGDNLERPGLKALIEDFHRDKDRSHLFTFKRDRLGRPDSPVDMVVIEDGLRRTGITIVRSDGVSQPSINGEGNLGELVMMLFEYDRAGQFLRDLSEQMIRTQLQLAGKGRWTGGNAPYGFVRALVNEQGEILEELPRGKRVRQAGCHVLIIPKDEEKIKTWLYILRLKEDGWGYKAIVRHLNELGIPSPDAGRIRTDHGLPHEVSGRWTLGTVRSLCMNRAIIGLLDYGRRSEGKHRRLGKDGPRVLEESDRNEHNKNKPKRIFNDPSLVVTSHLPSDPRFFDPARWEAIQAETEKRSKCQRGLPRTRDPARYPLSCRVIDLTPGCGSVMYARKHGQRPVYACGKYMATGGSDCDNNTVDGEAILRYTLDTLWELTDRLGAREKLRQKLLERACREQPENPLKNYHERERARLQQLVSDRRRQFEAAQRNLAIEENPEYKEVIREQYIRIKAELTAGEAQLAAVPAETARLGCTPEEEVEAAMRLFDDIRQVASDPAARAQVLPLVQRLKLWIGLHFAGVIKGKKRRVRRLAGGVLTFGPMPTPAGHPGSQSYLANSAERDDPRSRPEADMCEDAKNALNSETISGSGLLLPETHRRETRPQEGVSFTKGNRGDWI